MGQQRVILRADGNRSIGLGHISRCLALAEILSESFDIVFVTSSSDNYVINLIKETCDHIIVLPSESGSNFNQELSPYLTGAELVVLDGYSFTLEYERTVKSKAAGVIALDDIPRRHFVADLIINFCGAIKPSDYSKEFYTQLYTGLDYLFLRKPFLRNKISKKSPNQKLFLNMGGGDAGNETEKILNEILALGFRGEIEIVVGQNYPLATIQSFATNSMVFIKQGLTAEEMFNAMMGCSMAILPPSTVALEFLSTGGQLFLKQTGDNQKCIKKYLLDSKLALDYKDFAGYISEWDHRIEKDLSVETSFDGSSLKRIKDLFSSISISSRLTLRKATKSDCHQCFVWATDPEVRKYSYSKSEILWENHSQWFIAKISSSSSEFYVAEIDDIPLGQIRFDISEEDQTYVISYLIDKEWRGRGLGSNLLLRGVQKLRQSRSVMKITGFVQSFNTASLKAFDRAGFQKLPTLKYPDSCKFELLFEKP